MDDRIAMLPLFAPLTEEMVQNLTAYREKSLPRDIGRPSRAAGDKAARYQQRLMAAFKALVPEVAQARQRVYEMMENERRRAGHLSRRWLLVDVLYPPPLTPYQERLTDWHRENLLLFDENGEPEPSSTGAILILQELVHRKRWLPPPPLRPRSFYTFRYDDPTREAVPYELPLVPVTMSQPSILKPVPIKETLPYILTTPWKGVAWDDQSWILYEGGAIRWVGEPDEDMLKHWLCAQKLEQLSTPDRAGTGESKARLALQFLANRLIHVSSSSGSSRPA